MSELDALDRLEGLLGPADAIIPNYGMGEDLKKIMDKVNGNQERWTTFKALAPVLPIVIESSSDSQFEARRMIEEIEGFGRSLRSAATPEAVTAIMEDINSDISRFREVERFFQRACRVHLDKTIDPLVAKEKIFDLLGDGAVHDIRSMLSQLRRLAQAPILELASTILKLTSDAERLDRQLAARIDVDGEVRQFLNEILQHGSASLASLTPNVRQWLSARDGLSKFRVIARKN